MFGAIDQAERDQLVALRLQQSEGELKETLSNLRAIRDTLPEGSDDRISMQDSIDIIVNELNARGIRTPIHVARTAKIGICVVVALLVCASFLK